MGWPEVEAVVGEAKAIAWDGCHKIYLALDDEQVALFGVYGYRDGGSVMISAEHASPSEMLTYLHNWYDQSCSLRFIDAVASVPAGEDQNKGFTTLIGQFEDEDEEDDE
jgi:hypothetical protein